jgi:type II secretory ATPase GspE/PulE/Tfp pilus assembly ATPase PilB-like protein
MGIAPYLIASSLRGVLGQRLVRRLCPDCRTPDNVTEAAGDVKKRIAGLLAGRQAWKAGGCSNCTDGYRGRVGIFEMLTISARTRELIRASDFSLAQLRSVAVSDGFRSLVDDGVEKIARGITTVDEVLGAAEI